MRAFGSPLAHDKPPGPPLVALNIRSEALVPDLMAKLVSQVCPVPFAICSTRLSTGGERGRCRCGLPTGRTCPVLVSLLLLCGLPVSSASGVSCSCAANQIAAIRCLLDLTTVFDGYQNRDQLVPIIKMSTVAIALTNMQIVPNPYEILLPGAFRL